MILKLKNASAGWPPGGYPFVDPKTGMKFDAMSADLGLQALNVIKHRKANPHIYPASNALAFDVLAVRQEIVDYICHKTPSNCFDASKVPTAPSMDVLLSPPPGKVCLKCKSVELAPTYCKTCSGRRVVSWKCKQCGFENPK